MSESPTESNVSARQNRINRTANRMFGRGWKRGLSRHDPERMHEMVAKAAEKTPKNETFDNSHDPVGRSIAMDIIPFHLNSYPYVQTLLEKLVGEEEWKNLTDTQKLLMAQHIDNEIQAGRIRYKRENFEIDHPGFKTGSDNYRRFKSRAWGFKSEDDALMAATLFYLNVGNGQAPLKHSVWSTMIENMKALKESGFLEYMKPPEDTGYSPGMGGGLIAL